MTKMGLFDANGNFKSSSPESIQKLFPGFEISSDDATKCFGFANKRDKRGGPGPKETECSGKALKLVTCFSVYLTMACPKEKQHQSENCTKARAGLAKIANGPDSEEQPPK